MWIRLFIYLLISLATILIANLLTDLISFLLSFFKKSLSLEDKIKGFMRGTFWGLISSCIVAVLSVFMKTTMDIQFINQEQREINWRPIVNEWQQKPKEEQ